MESKAPYMIIASTGAVIHDGSPLAQGQLIELTAKDGDRLVALELAVVAPTPAEPVKVKRSKKSQQEEGTEQEQAPAEQTSEMQGETQQEEGSAEPELTPATAESGETW